MVKVATAVLKNQLSAYLRKVRKGTHLLVTDRGRVIAKILPADNADSPIDEQSNEELIASLISEGTLHQASSLQAPFAKISPIKIPKGFSLILEQERSLW